MDSELCESTNNTRAHRPIAYGPVPSRRLGRSLGINNLPSRICTYSCAYCQVGRAVKMQTDRQVFYEPEHVLREVADKMEQSAKLGELIDYLTFVPDGEPTLDVNLGREIDLLRPLRIKIAVITNASLVWREDVAEDLNKADWISLKIDSVDRAAWRRLNRPHRDLKLRSVLDGLLRFAESCPAELVTETMLVKGINDDQDSLTELSRFLAHLDISKAYLSIPTRPPAERWAQAPNRTVINRAHQLLGRRLDRVECLLAYEGDSFAVTGNVEEDLLAIAAVHPMRKEAVQEFLAKATSDWSTVHRLLEKDLLVETEYNGEKFYRGRLHEKSLQ